MPTKSVKGFGKFVVTKTGNASSTIGSIIGKGIDKYKEYNKPEAREHREHEKMEKLDREISLEKKKITFEKKQQELAKLRDRHNTSSSSLFGSSASEPIKKKKAMDFYGSSLYNK